MNNGSYNSDSLDQRFGMYISSGLKDERGSNLGTAGMGINDSSANNNRPNKYVPPHMRNRSRDTGADAPSGGGASQGWSAWNNDRTAPPRGNE